MSTPAEQAEEPVPAEQPARAPRAFPTTPGKVELAVGTGDARKLEQKGLRFDTTGVYRMEDEKATTLSDLVAGLARGAVKSIALGVWCGRLYEEPLLKLEDVVGMLDLDRLADLKHAVESTLLRDMGGEEPAPGATPGKA